ncbi:MAG: hypothetical protein ACO3CH_00085 [Ilumatobacteraceae bacterium]
MRLLLERDVIIRFITEEISEDQKWRNDRADYWEIKTDLPPEWPTMSPEQKFDFVYNNGSWVKDYGGGFTYPIDESDPNFEERYNDEFMNGNQTHVVHSAEEILN